MPEVSTKYSMRDLGRERTSFLETSPGGRQCSPKPGACPALSVPRAGGVSRGKGCKVALLRERESLAVGRSSPWPGSQVG